MYYLTLLILFVSGYSLAQTKEVLICKESTLRLKAQSTGAYSYEWYRDDVIIAGANSGELMVSEEGTYKAVGLNQDGCESGNSISIIVNHHKPSAVNDMATGNANTNVFIDVLKNDESACAALDEGTLTLIGAAQSGSAIVVNGKFTYTPNRDFLGTDTFTYTIKDKTGVISNIATVSVEIRSSALPVTLSYFKVAKQESSTDITWGTSEEVNSDHFEVQRSPDLKSWINIAQIPANGSSRTNLEYSEVDNMPEAGHNYYRLKMVDADQTFAYSAIRSVFFPELSWAEIYPNPVEDLLYVVIRNKEITNLRLISNSGTVFLSQPITSQSFTISMKQYQIGMYYLHFEKADGSVKVFKVMHD